MAHAHDCSCGADCACPPGQCECGAPSTSPRAAETHAADCGCGAGCRCPAGQCRCRVGRAIKLYYFDIRGLAEAARLLLAAAKVPYEDVRLASADELKQSGKLAYDQLPLLEYDGHLIVQSQAIYRFLARQYGFYGKNAIEAAHIDQVIEGFNDIRAKFGPIRSMPDGDAKNEAKTAFEREMLAIWLGHLDKLLLKNKNGTSFFVGDRLSLADIYTFNVLDSFKDFFPSMPSYAPNLQKLAERVAEQPGVREWLAVRG